MSVVGQSKFRRLLRKLSGKRPSASPNVRLPFALLGFLSIAFVFLSRIDSSLMLAGPLCIMAGGTLQLVGDFLLHRGRWVTGDLSRIVGFLCVNLGMVLFIGWAWASGEDAWFWYLLLVYGTLLMLLIANWTLRPRQKVRRVR